MNNYLEALLKKINIKEEYLPYFKNGILDKIIHIENKYIFNL